MPDPFAAPAGTLDVRYRSAEQIRAGGALANLASGPEIRSHGTPARLLAWPGTGLLVVDAVRARDFQVVQAVVIIFAGVFIFTNLVVDILYAYLDPRIRYQ